MYLDEDQYGEGNGVRVDYHFTASGPTATVTLSPANSGNTFHLHGLALAESALSLTNTVSTLADGGPGSLRQAIQNTVKGGTIVFATNGMITLTNELDINASLTILGPGPGNLVISGNQASRVFNIAADLNLALSGVTIENGKAPDGCAGANSYPPTAGAPGGNGGGICNLGNLNMSNCVVTANASGVGGMGGGGSDGSNAGASGAGGAGGGIYSAGTLMLEACVVSNNAGGAGADGNYGNGAGGTGGTGGAGGGIYALGLLVLSNCVVDANASGAGGNGQLGQTVGGSGGDGGDGGGIGGPGTFILSGCTISYNGTGDGGSGIFGGSGGNGGAGGGIFATNSAALTGCTVAYNTTGTGGSGSLGDQSGGGGAGGDGGGIDDTGTLVLSGNTVVSNTPGVGGTGYRVGGAYTGATGSGANIYAPYYDLSLTADTLPATGEDVVGSQVTFRAAFSGVLPCYQWLKNSGNGLVAIPNATNATLTVSNLTLADSGSYCLLASNTISVVTSTTNTFTVNPAPTAANWMVIDAAYQTYNAVFAPTWTISANSLIAGQLPSTQNGTFTNENAGGVAVLTDGQFGMVGGGTNVSLATCGANGGTALVYTLTNAASGYYLTNIVVCGGWSDDGRDEQAYTIYYATAVDPTNFIELIAVDYLPPAANGDPIATRVMIEPSGTRVLATNVSAVKFGFTSPNGGGESGYEGYAEIGLFGTTVLPAGRPTLAGSHYDKASGAFSFGLTGSSGQALVVETCMNLLSPVWVPVQTNILVSNAMTFSATNEPAKPARFSRVRTQ